MTLDLHAEFINVEDITDRFEELDGIKDNDGGTFEEPFTAELSEEWTKLRGILDELRGYGGDHQWRGDWYPALLISKHSFAEHIEEMVRDCYDLKNIPDFIEIDWQETANNCKVDYTELVIGAETYLYR